MPLYSIDFCCPPSAETACVAFFPRLFCDRATRVNARDDALPLHRGTLGDGFVGRGTQGESGLLP